MGTAAAEDPKLLDKLLDKYSPDRVAAAIDLRDDRLAVRGWRSEAQRDVKEVLDDLDEMGLRWIACTDVNRDGILVGPSHELVQRISARGFLVIIAGGVATVDDVARVRDSGAAGCIIGSALYSGLLSLPDAIEAGRAY